MKRKPNPVAVLALAKRPDGVTMDELEHITGCDVPDLEAAASALMSEGGLVLRGLVYYTPVPKPTSTMAPFTRKVLSDLRSAGGTGIEAARSKTAGTAEILAELASRTLAVELEGGIYISRETYEELTGMILEGLGPGERFSIARAKNRSGLSRKYLIPLLERMERDGYSKRQNEFHIVMFRNDRETQDHDR